MSDFYCLCGQSEEKLKGLPVDVCLTSFRKLINLKYLIWEPFRRTSS